MTRRFLEAMVFVAAAAGALATAAPALAGSAATDAFVANVHPNIDYLDQSSRLATRTSTSAKLRGFARGEATEQTLAGNQLVAWTQTRTASGVAATIGAPIVDGAVVVTAPVDVAVGVSNGVDDVLTGRSVAVDTPAIIVARPRTPAPGTLLPSGETDMARLSQMRGRRFDAFYVTTQKDALRQLVTLYTEYMRDGDDPALRAMSERQLPIVKARLTQLGAM